MNDWCICQWPIQKKPYEVIFVFPLVYPPSSVASYFTKYVFLFIFSEHLKGKSGCLSVRNSIHNNDFLDKMASSPKIYISIYNFCTVKLFLQFFKLWMLGSNIVWNAFLHPFPIGESLSLSAVENVTIILCGRQLLAGNYRPGHFQQKTNGLDVLKWWLQPWNGLGIIRGGGGRRIKCSPSVLLSGGPRKKKTFYVPGIKPFFKYFQKTCVTSGSFNLIKLTICESLKSPLDQTNRNKLRSSEMR